MGCAPALLPALVLGPGTWGWLCLLAVGPKQWRLLEESDTQGLAMPHHHFFLGHLGRSLASSLGEQCNAYTNWAYSQMLLFFKTVIIMHIFKHKHKQSEQPSGPHVPVSCLPTTSILSPCVYLSLLVCLRSSFLKLSLISSSLSASRRDCFM